MQKLHPSLLWNSGRLMEVWKGKWEVRICSLCSPACGGETSMKFKACLKLILTSCDLSRTPSRPQPEGVIGSVKWFTPTPSSVWLCSLRGLWGATPRPPKAPMLRVPAHSRNFTLWSFPLSFECELLMKYMKIFLQKNRMKMC